jgi:hypothetical protein
MDKNIRNKIGEWLPQICMIEKHGVITQRLAACLIGVTDRAIKKAGEKQAIRCYSCENVNLYSFQDCLLYKQTREKHFRKKRQNEINEKLKSENYDEWLALEEEKKIQEEYRQEQEKEDEFKRLREEDILNSIYGEHISDEEVRLKELENQYLKERIKILEEIVKKEKKSNRKNKPL